MLDISSDIPFAKSLIFLNSFSVYFASVLIDSSISSKTCLLVSSKVFNFSVSLVISSTASLSSFNLSLYFDVPLPSDASILANSSLSRWYSTILSSISCFSDFFSNSYWSSNTFIRASLASLTSLIDSTSTEW